MIAEVTNQGWWQEYLSLLQDPAHILLELTMILFFDVIVGMLMWPLVKRAVHRHDIKHHEKEEG
jgi:hypothetical protein